MNREELLAELDDYFVLREDPVKIAEKTLPNGHLLRRYQVRGVLPQANNVVHYPIVEFWVYREGDVPQEAAYYDGDPINSFWRLKVVDYITVTNRWSGRVFFSCKPVAICRMLQDPAVGEKWVQVEEIAPDTFSVTDIVGDVIIEI